MEFDIISEMVKTAITEKRLLELVYDGFPRIVEVHIYGKKNGQDGIFIYQVDGSSSTGRLGWKRMYFSNISNMEILDQKFDGRRESSDKHSEWDVIYRLVD